MIHLLSKNPKTASIPFIFLTAKSERGDFRKGMEMGADDYITKPFDDLELLRAVESRLKKAEALKSEYSRDEAGINTFLDEAKSLKELKNLSDSAKLKVFKKKELIYTEGNNPNYLYLLQSGKVKTFRAHEYGKEQLGRASFSIAEGSGKFSKADRKNYFTTARGSVFECVAVLDILCDQGILQKEEFAAFSAKADELSRILYAMIKNLS